MMGLEVGAGRCICEGEGVFDGEYRIGWCAALGE